MSSLPPRGITYQTQKYAIRLALLFTEYLYQTEEVAWCTQQRNNARVIPDGTLTGVTFLQTGTFTQLVCFLLLTHQDFYVQVLGYGNFVNLNIVDGDEGGSYLC